MIALMAIAEVDLFWNNLEITADTDWVWLVFLLLPETELFS